jgi:hypothetical protein
MASLFQILSGFTGAGVTAYQLARDLMDGFGGGAMAPYTFKNKVIEGEGLTQSAHYEVFFNLPKVMETSYPQFGTETLRILCQSVSFPGRMIATSDLPIYGPPVKMPYGFIYQDFTCSFLCTNNMASRRIFEKWQRSIIDPTTNYVNYYDNFYGDISVFKLDQSNGATHLVKYEEVWPIGIIEQELSAGNTDFLRLFVQFAYRRWRTPQDSEAGSNPVGTFQPPSAGDGTFNKDDGFKDKSFPSVPSMDGTITDVSTPNSGRNPGGVILT